MLSISALKNSQDSKDYYTASGYYQQQDELAQGEGSTAWFGQGASALDLSGDVDMQKFEELLDGKVAGYQLGRKRGGELEHQPGWDLTFSAPKSLSILAIISGDERLINAHKSAVQATLTVLEQEFTKTRVRNSKDQVVRTATESLIIAQFLHSLSRENDPQLHTHCVIPNATLRPDGKWRSLESVDFYDHKMLLGQIYRNELALQVKKLGYQLNVNYRTGLFEIKGVPEKAIEIFSKRSEEIESIAKSTDAQEKARATLISRKRKVKVPKEVLLATWDEECKAACFKNKKIGQVIFNATNNIPQSSSELICGERSVEQAIDHLSQKEAVFSNKELCEAALKLGLGEIDYTATVAAVQEQQKNQSIAPSSLAVRGRVVAAYTTQNAMAREQYILKLLQQGKAVKNKLSHCYQIDKQLKESGLSLGQQKAIQLIMTSKDQFLGIQGYAGVGKTTMLRCAKPLIESTGYQLRAFAPTHAAVDALREETGIASRTLSSFLLSMENKQSKEKVIDCSKEIWIVDEASLIGAKDMATLLTQARAAKSRVVLLGDKSQLGAVSWGKPFHLMMEHGMSCAVMKEIKRQKVESLKTAVKTIIKANSYKISWPFIKKHPESIFKQQIASAREDVGCSLSAISSNVIEITKKEERQQRLINYYAGLEREELNNTLVIIPDNKTRHKLMPHLREVALKNFPGVKNDVMANQEQLNTTILCEVDCPNTAHAQCYGPGEVVEFSKNYKKLGIRSGDRFYVVKVNGKENIVFLSPFNNNGDRNLLEWNPEKIAGKTNQAVNLFQEYERSIVVGEKIVFNKTDKDLGFKNGDIAKVTNLDIQNNEVTAKLQSGKKVTFNCDKFKQFDHGYAITAYKAQGKTTNQVIVFAESYCEHLITQKSFYVALSRAKYKALIITNDKEALQKKLGERPGHKTSSLEQEEMNKAIERIFENNRPKNNIEVIKENPIFNKFEEPLKSMSLSI